MSNFISYFSGHFGEGRNWICIPSQNKIHPRLFDEYDIVAQLMSWRFRLIHTHSVVRAKFHNTIQLILQSGHWWIPLTKASDAKFRCFLWSAPKQTVEQTLETPVIWDAIELIMICYAILPKYFRLITQAQGQSYCYLESKLVLL